MIAKNHLENRHHLKRITRDFFYNREYREVDTPIITVCPGTEVHLQYFDTAWEDLAGNRYKRYLRSSPELHMKRLAAYGNSKIFQLGACFRNRGELGPWHNPEFFMLEWYHVGQTYLGLITETEEYLRESADQMATITGRNPDQFLPKRFQKITVSDAFKEFAQVTLIDGDESLADQAIASGVISVQPSDDFETAFFKTLIEKVEPALERFGGCVLYDYPPSQAALAVVDAGRACRFEFYVGRVELCNGFYELTGEQANRIRAREAQKCRERFGYDAIPLDDDFFTDMAKFTSPCAGNALGFDRWLSLLCGSENLNSAILFRDFIQ